MFLQIIIHLCILNSYSMRLKHVLRCLMHLCCSSAVCVRLVVNPVMKDVHNVKGTHAEYNTTVCTHLVKCDPACVVFLDDCVQSSWQYGEWWTAAETLVSLWNILSSSSALGFGFQTVGGVWAVCDCSPLIYLLCLNNAQWTHTHTLEVDEEERSRNDNILIILHMLSGIFFFKSLK